MATHSPKSKATRRRKVKVAPAAKPEPVTELDQDEALLTPWLPPLRTAFLHNGKITRISEQEDPRVYQCNLYNSISGDEFRAVPVVAKGGAN